MEALVADQPAILWIQGSIHGFELSGTEGMLLLLEHLTTRDDTETLRALENTVILVDPLVNPDGRDAFAHFNHQRISRAPRPERDDWANDFTSWQSLTFRTGHYFFDNNRDWTAQTQRVARARARAILEWRPQALIDAHEWTPDIEFFFPHMWGGDRPRGGAASYAETWCDEFGASFAEIFHREGRPFTTREVYGCGLGTSIAASTTAWAPWIGAVGILFEQGSSRGLALTRPDGSVRTLRYAAENQYLGSWALVERASRDRDRLLREYYAQHQAFIEDESDGIQRFLLPPTGDPNLRAEAVNLLLNNQVEVDMLTSPIRLGSLVDAEGGSVGEREFAAGTYVVEVAQPRVINILFGVANTTTIPHLFNLEAFGSRDGRSLPVQRVNGPLLSASDAAALEAGVDRVSTLANGGNPAPPQIPQASYAYIIDGAQALGVSAAYHLRAAGHRLSISTSTIRLASQELTPGTVVVLVEDNPPTIHEAVREVAERFHLEVRAVDSGLAEQDYPSLGSGSLVAMRTPTIALVAEDPVNAYSFGWNWFTIERQYHIPVTVLRAGSLASSPLHRFDTILLPELSGSAFARLLGPEGLDRLRRWVEDGGVLVTLGSATEFARNQLGILDGLQSWYETDEGRDASPTSLPEATIPALLRSPGYNPGSQTPADWISAGYQENARIHVVGQSSRHYIATEGSGAAGGYVVATYAPLSDERKAAAGWAESAAQVEGGVYLYHQRVGRGRIVAFAEDPNLRAQLRGTDRLFLNALVLSASAR